MMNLMVRSATGRYRQACKAEVLEVAAQYLAASLQRRVSRPLTSPSAVERFLVQALAPRDAEVFCAMFLDNRHRLIQFDEMFRGTIDGSSVYPREVVRRMAILGGHFQRIAVHHVGGRAVPIRMDRMWLHSRGRCGDVGVELSKGGNRNEDRHHGLRPAAGVAIGGRGAAAGVPDGTLSVATSVDHRTLLAWKPLRS